jgi:2,3-bisphosphoglycerate-independent phosphoglycerate mutase
MADHPHPDLQGQTPLAAAHTPNMDSLAQTGTLGMVRTLVPGYPLGSDIANMSILGYNPQIYYAGRAPLEAANIGVELGAGDVAFRCNLVHVKSGKMLDFSAGHITTEEAKPLLKLLDQTFGTPKIKFYLGTSYRHLVVWKGGPLKASCTPPHDISQQEIQNFLPKGPGHKEIQHLMQDSQLVLEGHEINRNRRQEGKAPANMIWLWGQGQKPSMPRLVDTHHITGSVISAVDLVKGLGIYAGLQVIKVPGATGYLDTNYAGKVDAALQSLKKQDLVYLHVEAPDECGHNGDLKGKLQAIEDFDSKIVGPIREGLKETPHRILLLPDHPTPLDLRTHVDEPVPFILYDSTQETGHPQHRYNEAAAQATGIFVQEGWTLMERLILKQAASEAKLPD